MAFPVLFTRHEVRRVQHTQGWCLLFPGSFLLISGQTLQSNEPHNPRAVWRFPDCSWCNNGHPTQAWRYNISWCFLSSPSSQYTSLPNLHNLTTQGLSSVNHFRVTTLTSQCTASTSHFLAASSGNMKIFGAAWHSCR